MDAFTRCDVGMLYGGINGYRHVNGVRMSCERDVNLQMGLDVNKAQKSKLGSNLLQWTYEQVVDV